MKLFSTEEQPPTPPDPDTPPIVNAAQLRAARAYLGLTLIELAKVAKVSHQTICRLERDKSYRPQEATLRKLVGAFYDRGLEVFGTSTTSRGIRDFLPLVTR